MALRTELTCFPHSREEPDGDPVQRAGQGQIPGSTHSYGGIRRARGGLHCPSTVRGLRPAGVAMVRPLRLRRLGELLSKPLGFPDANLTLALDVIHTHGRVRVFQYAPLADNPCSQRQRC